MGITITNTPRWGMNFEPGALHMRMLGHIGEYDIWYDPNVPSYTIICNGNSKAVEHSTNYTDYTYLSTGDLAPQDTDVELDPYHMCLLYQLVEAVGDPARRKKT